MLDEGIKQKVLAFQTGELTEHIIYKRLAALSKDPHNRDVLMSIAEDELRHHEFWKAQTGQSVKPRRLMIWWYVSIARVFGITFGIKLMEKGEERAQAAYLDILRFIPEADSVLRDEDDHEARIIAMIDEERLRYVGSMVLGLNDALVELTGALAGFTLALQNTRLIAMTGLITGIAASMSMAASEYLSTKSEADGRNPLKASLYTGTAYILTVLFLILPFLLFANIYLCLGCTILNAMLVIFMFTAYISIAQDASFLRRFFEMAFISLGIAALSFGIGYIVRIFLYVEM
ncbi:VIT1/CCC1 transporter family protein [bacterium]|nr:VIT1/CCC1 transporter family protein [bacterium]